MSLAALAPAVLSDLAGVFQPPAGGLSDTELGEGLRRLGRLAARVEARRAEFLAEADRRGLARRQGYASTTAWLIALSGDPAPVCRSRLSVAASLQEMPQTRAAFTAGEIPETRVRLLAQARESAPAQFARDEARLVAQAATASSQRLPQLLGEWRRHTDPEGAEADTARLFTRRALHASPAWSEMVHSTGTWTPKAAAWSSPPSAPCASQPPWTPTTAAPRPNAGPTPWSRSAAATSTEPNPTTPDGRTSASPSPGKPCKPGPGWSTWKPGRSPSKPPTDWPATPP